MNDLLQTVDWSRAQFALTAMYHWLFVPLTIGLSLIVAVMESIYYKTGDPSWKSITKFWMTLFGINFACGVATGIILEFEFGTNWSNYSWFVGDIFGAPLAIEGIAAFFLEATFVAVMFFGWEKVSRRFHLLSTWLVAVGVCLSALWILVANAWMQNPVGMRFDPGQMRNVMDNFWQVAFNSVAVNKFLHAVFSGWVLGAVFVIGVSCWLLWRGKNRETAIRSLRIASWTGLAGIILTIWTGDGSAVAVARVQPMKLAAMEGLYNGKCGQEIEVFGPISIPKGLSLLANHDADSFVPGINDLIEGREITETGDTVYSAPYAERMERGRIARQALADYGEASKANDIYGMATAQQQLETNYKYFGYGYLDSPQDAVPPVALTFWSFRVMVIAGGYLLALFIAMISLLKYKPDLLKRRWLQIAGMLSVAVVWICSEAGWVVAEVGRQPWVIQDLMPTTAAISDIQPAGVKLTFWIFSVVFTLMLAAEVSIMAAYLNRTSKKDIIKEEDI